MIPATFGTRPLDDPTVYHQMRNRIMARKVLLEKILYYEKENPNIYEKASLTWKRKGFIHSPNHGYHNEGRYKTMRNIVVDKNPPRNGI